MKILKALLSMLTQVSESVVRRLPFLRSLWPLWVVGLAQLAACNPGVIGDSGTGETLVTIYAQDVQNSDRIGMFWVTAKIAGKRTAFLAQQPDAAIPFVVDKGLTGTLEVDLSALREDGCLYRRGQGTIEIPGPGSYRLGIPVKQTTNRSCLCRVTVNGGGLVRSPSLVDDCTKGKVCSVFFPDGGKTELAADSTDPEWSFASWSSCQAESGSRCTVDLTQPISITANFKRRDCSADSWCVLSTAALSQDLHAIAGDGTGKVWAAGKDQTVLRIADGGITQVKVDPAVTVQDLLALSVDASGQRILTGGTSSTILYYDSTKGQMMRRGTSPSGAIRSLIELSPTKLLAADNFGNVDESDSAGASWPSGTVSVTANNSLHASWVDRDGVPYLVGEATKVMKRPVGMGWTALGSPLGVPLNGISGSQSGGPIWVAGNANLLAQWTGAAWSKEAVPGASTNLNGVWSDPTGSEVWAVGDGLKVVRWQSVSRLVTTVPTDTLAKSCNGCKLTGVWGSGKKVWVIGEKGLVAYYQLP
ncbi:MAG: hypothetical protein U1A78_17675 [Polyangia bacterium]